MEELKQLDVGYGYTADHGETYPFRGKGVGLMPTLEEVLTNFPEQSFLIHIKSNDRMKENVLAEYLSKGKVENLSVYGGDEPIAALKEAQPEMRVMSIETMKSCLLPYIAVGWTGYIPSAWKTHSTYSRKIRSLHVGLSKQICESNGIRWNKSDSRCRGWRLVRRF